MKKLYHLALFSFGMIGLVALGIKLAPVQHVQANQRTQPPPSAAIRRDENELRQSLERAQLEQQLIRSDATAVMLGEWLGMRDSGVTLR